MRGKTVVVMRDTEQYLAPWFRYERFNTQDDVPFGFTADDNFDLVLALPVVPPRSARPASDPGTPE